MEYQRQFLHLVLITSTLFPNYFLCLSPDPSSLVLVHRSPVVADSGSGDFIRLSRQYRPSIGYDSSSSLAVNLFIRIRFNMIPK